MRATRRLRTFTAALITAFLTALTVCAPAIAAPDDRRLGPALAEDLKTDCANHAAEAGGTRGWTRSRFELCHHYEQKVNLYRIDTAEYRGFIEYELWVLGFAYDGSRRVDYVVSVEDVKISTQLPADPAFITVTMSGCPATNISCTGATSRSDNIPGWYTTPAMSPIVVTSPDDTGTPPYYTVGFQAQFDVDVEYRDNMTIPYEESRAFNTVRFDSAKSALGNGKFHGTVFTDHVPTLQLSMQTGSDHLQEARHVNDALTHPERTFPSHISKNVPGRDPARPLHRLMDAQKRAQNHGASVAICEDVWGPSYPTGGLQCDEYPFQSTYEGSYTSTVGQGASDTDQWHGSARPIDGSHNQNGGTHLSNFYGANRILDGDPFLVNVLT